MVSTITPQMSSEDEQLLTGVVQTIYTEEESSP